MKRLQRVDVFDLLRLPIPLEQAHCYQMPP
jgi:hypothetical protein